MSGIKAVFFDLYGTLAGFDPPREDIQMRAAEKFGFVLTKNGIDSGYHIADQFMTRQNVTKPVRTLNTDERRAFFSKYEQLVLEGAGHSVELDVAEKIWLEVSKQQYRLTLFPDVITGLGRLRERGLILAVISNMNQTSELLCEEMNLTGHVDFAVTSGETGFEKPDSRIFQVALLKAGVLAEEAVFIGDQLDSDIRGAQNAGMHPILMDRYGGHSHYQIHPRAVDMDTAIALIS